MVNTTLAERIGCCYKQGKKKGYAVHLYQDRIGVKPWPVWKEATPSEPSPETVNYIKSRQIARAKAREKVT